MDQATGATAPSSPLRAVLERFRTTAAAELEMGTCFQGLIDCCLREKSIHRNLYSDVWTYAAWAEPKGMDKRDAGIGRMSKVHALAAG